MIKALFFDIDGTLVSFDTHAIPETTIEAIAAAKAKGIRIFIATGRPAVIINQPFCLARPWTYRWLYNHERRILFRRRRSDLQECNSCH